MHITAAVLFSIILGGLVIYGAINLKTVLNEPMGHSVVHHKLPPKKAHEMGDSDPAQGRMNLPPTG
jgi:hypothetical protein